MDIPKQFKLNIPETATVSYYYPEEEVVITPLVQDGAYRSPKANLEETAYGPCSYSRCPLPSSVPCTIDISIEGINRKWARRAGNGAWLAGYWEEGNFDSSKLSRWNLILEDVDQAGRVLPLLSNDSVYTINLIGRRCAENSEFRDKAKDIIRKSVDAHKEGYKVEVKQMLPSEFSALSRFTFKVGVAVGISFINPAAAMTIGTGAWGAGRAVQELCEREAAKRFWGTFGDAGGNAFLRGKLQVALFILILKKK